MFDNDLEDGREDIDKIDEPESTFTHSYVAEFGFMAGILLD